MPPFWPGFEGVKKPPRKYGFKNLHVHCTVHAYKCDMKIGKRYQFSYFIEHFFFGGK